MQNEINRLKNEIEDLKNKEEDSSQNSDIYLTESLQEQIDDLNSLLNDKKNEIINIKRYIDEIRENLKIIRIIPQNMEEKEALDVIQKILIKID